MKSHKERSWFKQIQEILALYNLPSPTCLLADPPTKREWANITKKAVNTYWKQDICNKAKLYPSLAYLNTDIYTPGKSHPILASVRSSPADILRVAIVHRFITGTYMLRSNRKKFNQYAVEPSCPLCSASKEDREHVLLDCKAYKEEREEALQRILPYLGGGEFDRKQWIQLLLDCSGHQSEDLDANHWTDIYYHARTLMAKIARRRQASVGIT